MHSGAMAELLQAEPMTLKAWADMAEDEPGELVNGRLEEEEVPDHLHEAVVAFLIATLHAWASRRRAPVYLLVDPEARLLEVYELGADGRYVLDVSSSKGKLSLPGCEGLDLDLDSLWSEVDWVIGSEAEAEAEPGDDRA